MGVWGWFLHISYIRRSPKLNWLGPMEPRREALTCKSQTLTPSKKTSEKSLTLGDFSIVS